MDRSSGSSSSRRLSVLAAHVSSSGQPAFVSLEQAAHMPGVRVTFVQGVPAIFAECLKNLMDAVGVNYSRVVHPMMGRGDNQALLYSLTAQRSLPTLFHEDDCPRSTWGEQLALVDRLGVAGGRPSLLPAGAAERTRMFGLLHELLGENGVCWNKRLLFGENALTRKYGWSAAAEAAAAPRLVEQVAMFGAQLVAQQARGQPHYLVGDALSAVDIYWATCTYMLFPPGPEMLPRTKQNQGLVDGAFSWNPEPVQEAIDEHLQRFTEHRSFVLGKHCVIPAVLGGTPVPGDE